jgi:hypothetical protein
LGVEVLLMACDLMAVSIFWKRLFRSFFKHC